MIYLPIYLAIGAFFMAFIEVVTPNYPYLISRAYKDAIKNKNWKRSEKLLLAVVPALCTVLLWPIPLFSFVLYLFGVREDKRDE